MTIALKIKNKKITVTEYVLVTCNNIFLQACNCSNSVWPPEE